MDGPRTCDQIDKHNGLLTHTKTASEPIFENYSLRGKVSTLNFTTEVNCLQYYHGNKCSVYCNANNASGHFTCNKTTGVKECLTDYYGDNCTTYCKAPTESPHFHCNKITGSRVCFKRWTGVECNFTITPVVSSSFSMYVVKTISISAYLNQSSYPRSSYPRSSYPRSSYPRSSYPRFVTSIIDFNETSVVQVKSERRITSTTLVITLSIVVCMMVVATLFVVLFIRSRYVK